MCDAIKYRVRYDQPDENGNTRRERNEQFGQDHLTPELELDEVAQHYLNLYYRLSNRLKRVEDGNCSPIPPSEFLAWVTLTGVIVLPWEYDMLSQMDLAFCEEMNAELAAFQERQTDKK